jgi:hypothetical protein
MSCSACLRDKPVVARGLCNACYQRWHKTGTTDYQRRIGRSTCSVGGCSKPVVSNDLCDTHRKRMERHGHLEETRSDSWGAKEGHPLYNAWAYLRRHGARHPVVDVWRNDFLQFVADLGERPSSKHKLFAADETRPIGPGNYVWKRAVTEKVPGEDEKTYQARAHRVYRSLRPEAFKGYDLKRMFGLTVEQYDAMFAEQKGCCAICGQRETHIIRGRKLSLAVDHCHSAGHVRGLLCSKCNTGLGSFRDDPVLLQAAIEYLARRGAIAAAAEPC